MRNRKPCAASTLLQHTLERACEGSSLRRVGLLLGLLLAGCSLSMAGSTTGGTPRATPTHSLACLVAIGSVRKKYLECHGSGSPTVVLVSGLDAAADVWTGYQAHPSLAVFNAVAGFTRVCTYDRPGTPTGDDLMPSRSTLMPQPSTPHDAVRDLYALLLAAGEPGPSILVGHSYGGLITRLYTGEYPSSLAGLVFAPQWQTAMTQEQRRIVQAITDPSKDQLAQYPAMGRINVDESRARARAATQRRSLPAVVLSRDTAAHPMGPFIASLVAQGTLPAFRAGRREATATCCAWNQAQYALARPVPNTQHLVVKGLDHTIQIDHPQAVADALHQVFDISLTDLVHSSSLCNRCPGSWGRPGPRKCDMFTMKGANGNGTSYVC